LFSKDWRKGCKERIVYLPADAYAVLALSSLFYQKGKLGLVFLCGRTFSS
jgi:hypothetical protein